MHCSHKVTYFSTRDHEFHCCFTPLWTKNNPKVPLILVSKCYVIVVSECFYFIKCLRLKVLIFLTATSLLVNFKSLPPFLAFFIRTFLFWTGIAVNQLRRDFLFRFWIWIVVWWCIETFGLCFWELSRSPKRCSQPRFVLWANCMRSMPTLSGFQHIYLKKESQHAVSKCIAEAITVVVLFIKSIFFSCMSNRTWACLFWWGISVIWCFLSDQYLSFLNNISGVSIHYC